MALGGPLTQRILLVEDDESLGRQIVGHLRDAGFEPTWLKDGDAAVREPVKGYALVVLELMQVEFDLLAALARRAGAAIQRSWLVDNVLDPEREGTERTLDVHISRLRKKLGASGKHVATVWGVGYRLETQAPA